MENVGGDVEKGQDIFFLGGGEEEDSFVLYPLKGRE